ncbi:MAG: sulfur carrier protein ThiS [Marinifilaceae bacterium]|jgi:sulfur carrier protein
MIVYVNDQKVEAADNTTLLQLLTQLNTPSKGIAIAINQEIIPSSNWGNHSLKGGEKILVIRATQGG